MGPVSGRPSLVAKRVEIKTAVGGVDRGFQNQALRLRRGFSNRRRRPPLAGFCRPDSRVSFAATVLIMHIWCGWSIKSRSCAWVMFLRQIPGASQKVLRGRSLPQRILFGLTHNLLGGSVRDKRLEFVEICRGNARDGSSVRAGRSGVRKAWPVPTTCGMSCGSSPSAESGAETVDQHEHGLGQERRSRRRAGSRPEPVEPACRS